MAGIWQDVGVGAAQGAGTGLIAGGPFGAAAGAVIGGGLAFVGGRSRRKQEKRVAKYQKAEARARILAAESQLADFNEAAGYRRQSLIGRGLGDSSIARSNAAKTIRQRNLHHKNIDLHYKGYQLARKGRLAEQRLGYINLLDSALQSIVGGGVGYATGWNPSTMSYRGAGQFNSGSSPVLMGNADIH